jgi:hypothetical protein
VLMLSSDGDGLDVQMLDVVPATTVRAAAKKHAHKKADKRLQLVDKRKRKKSIIAICVVYEGATLTASVQRVYCQQTAWHCATHADI